MEFENFKALFEENLAKNSLSVYADEQIIRKFYNLTTMMMAKNQVMNITAIREVERIIPLHYIDCLKIAHLIPQNAHVIDVGCGGGFPTLPLAIVRPDICITALDSTEKKVNYVIEVASALHLGNVTGIIGRAEELAQSPSLREKFTVATSRAVARLCLLDELCLPFVEIGGQMIVMKGAMGQEELDEAQKGIEILGGSVKNVIFDQICVLDERESRVNIVIEKVSSTPTKYPRQFGQIKKKPL